MSTRPRRTPGGPVPLHLLHGSVAAMMCLLAGAAWYVPSTLPDGAWTAVIASGVSAVAVLVCLTGLVALLLLSRWHRALLGAVAEKDRIETTLRKAEEYQRLFRQASDPMLILDPVEGVVLDANCKACEVYDVPREMFMGRPLASVIHDSRSIKAQLRTLAKDGGSQEFETTHLRWDSTPIHFLVTASVVEFQGRRAILSTQRDVTRHKAHEKQLAHRAFHDPLTDLANRALFHERVEHAVARGIRHAQTVIVGYVDLDKFKEVNDTLGHAAGDELLITVSRRLRGLVRVTDTVARLGGDEFAFLLEDAQYPEDAIAVAERILEELSAPFALEGNVVTIGASVGIACSLDVDTAEALLHNADLAMYAAKHRGRGCHQLFRPDMQNVELNRNDTESELQRALERAEFELLFQPIVALGDGRTAGVEALVRWNHPVRGQLAPGAFLPLAEETGLIVPLGAWILREACRHAREWQQVHPQWGVLDVTVNLSERQFNQEESLLTAVTEALSASGLQPSSLILEVPESVVMHNTQAALRRLNALKEIGVQIAIDDFGTGYSNISFLQQFPIDLLKIDHSFIEGIADSPTGPALSRAIVALAGALGLRTVAEGIRTREQLGVLQTIGCEYGQGFLFARPLPALAVGQLLQGRDPASASGQTQELELLAFELTP